MFEKLRVISLAVACSSAMMMVGGCGSQNVETDKISETTEEDVMEDAEEDTTEDVTEDAAEGNAEDIAEADDQRPNNELVIRGTVYTGLENLKNDNNDDGTYFYEDMTSDGLTVITNMSYPNSIRDGQDMDAYAINIVCAQIDNNAEVEEPEQNEKLSAKFTCPVYTVKWKTGSNEDTRQAIGVVVLNDNYTYYYGFKCPIDEYEDNEEFYMEELENIELEEI